MHIASTTASSDRIVNCVITFFIVIFRFSSNFGGKQEHIRKDEYIPDIRLRVYGL